MHLCFCIFTLSLTDDSRVLSRLLLAPGPQVSHRGLRGPHARGAVPEVPGASLLARPTVRRHEQRAQRHATHPHILQSLAALQVLE